MTDTALPAPLTPPDCDVRSFPDMMLDVALLRDSDFAAHPDPEVFRSGVLAWCAAFHQVPAASLPDDNAAIARLVGLGRDVTAAERFGGLREQGALHGFVKCSDGRLYHPVIAEKAFAALASKEKNKARTIAATEKRRALYAARLAAEAGERDVQRDDQRDDGRHDAQNVHQPNRTKQNRTKQKEEGAPSLPLGAGGDKKAPYQIPSWVPASEWDGFVAMRKKKWPLTDRAAALIVNELSKLKTLGHDPAAVLDQSTRNSWRDVYPIKSEAQNRGKEQPAGQSFGSTVNRVVRRRNECGLAGAGYSFPGAASDSAAAEGHLGQNLLPPPDDNAR